MKGTIVAIVTPFNDKKVDYETLKKLVVFHIKNGTDAILPCGTTGESPTLSTEEHEKVIETCIEASQGKIPILAGTGSNATAEAISLTKHAAKAGAQAALVVTPYYNKPTQEGIYLHFKAVAESAAIPIIIYNIPGRCSQNIEPATMARLAQDCKNIIGVKEASGSLDQMQTIKLLCPENFILLSGDDALTLPLLSIKGQGVISVIANIIPQEVTKMVHAFQDGSIREAQRLHYHMLPLIKAMFLETNPVPVKTAMGLLGMCPDTVRLPLCAMTKTNHEKLKTELTNYGLL